MSKVVINILLFTFDWKRETLTKHKQDQEFIALADIKNDVNAIGTAEQEMFWWE